MNLRPGDIIGFAGGGHIARSINAGTWGWPFRHPRAWRGISHVAVVAPRTTSPSDSLVLFESSTLATTPCLIQGKVVQGVQCQDLKVRLQWYADRGGTAWHYSLRKPLSESAVVLLGRFCRDHIGVRYDVRGALNARSTPIAWLRRKFTREDLTELYCNEFVGAALRYAGAWEIANVSTLSPNRFVRLGVREKVLGYPGQLYVEDWE
jgi:hypothetical protein